MVSEYLALCSADIKFCATLTIFLLMALHFMKFMKLNDYVLIVAILIIYFLIFTPFFYPTVFINSVLLYLMVEATSNYMWRIKILLQAAAVYRLAALACAVYVLLYGSSSNFISRIIFSSFYNNDGEFQVLTFIVSVLFDNFVGYIQLDVHKFVERNREERIARVRAWKRLHDNKKVQKLSKGRYRGIRGSLTSSPTIWDAEIKRVDPKRQEQIENTPRRRRTK